MHKLNVRKLRDKAREHGDTSGHAIQKRTGINQTTVYRILRGGAQPDLITALRLSITYDFDIRDVMDEVNEPAEATA
ncbi:helix-turn-helix domain-containing protein [Streptomyces sp. NPDC051016]|uniref:helix-turn-helix domain-containing protein n=1 Tax=Streptomyces sp. NPDC051016 TaxID=3365638 RepID=UPI00378F153D